MAFLRFNRDHRGYEHFYLVEPTTNRRGKTRARVLYWFRTPPNVKVGRTPFDESVRRALEAQNPGVAFDWRKIADTPIPSAETERWRERRRAERAERGRAQGKPQALVRTETEPGTENLEPGTENLEPGTENFEPRTENLSRTENLEPRIENLSATENREPRTPNLPGTENRKRRRRRRRRHPSRGVQDVTPAAVAPGPSDPDASEDHGDLGDHGEPDEPGEPSAGD